MTTKAQGKVVGFVVGTVVALFHVPVGVWVQPAVFVLVGVEVEVRVLELVLVQVKVLVDVGVGVKVSVWADAKPIPAASRTSPIRMRRLMDSGTNITHSGE